MIKLKSIVKSTKKGKKFTATFSNSETGRDKTIHFGASGYRDFTLINDKNSKFYIKESSERAKIRAAYIARHAKDLLTESSSKGLSAGALSYFVLWTGKTFRSGLLNYKKKYNV